MTLGESKIIYLFWHAAKCYCKNCKYIGVSVFPKGTLIKNLQCSKCLKQGTSVIIFL
jgi:hypothetical protein